MNIYIYINNTYLFMTHARTLSRSLARARADSFFFSLPSLSLFLVRALSQTH